MAPFHVVVTLAMAACGIGALVGETQGNGNLLWLSYFTGYWVTFAAIATGRMPEGLRNAGAHALRYNARVNAYLSLLTGRYPFSGPPTLEPVETRWAEGTPSPADAPA